MKINTRGRNDPFLTAEKNYRKEAACCDPKKPEPTNARNQLYASNTNNNDANQSDKTTSGETKEKLSKITAGQRDSSYAPPAKPGAKIQHNPDGNSAKIAKIATKKLTPVWSQEAGETPLLNCAMAIIQAFARAASQPFSNDVVRERAALLSEILKRAPKHDHKAMLEAIVPRLHDQATLEAIKQFIEAYPRWFAEILSETTKVVSLVGRTIRRNEHQVYRREFLDRIGSLERNAKIIRESAGILQDLYTRFYRFIKGISKTTPVPKEGLSTMWLEGLNYIERRIYDIMNFANIAAAIEMTVPELKAAKGPMVLNALKMLNQYDPSRLDFNLQLAVGLNKSFATDHKVELLQGFIPRLIIPDRMHLDLFWSAYKLIGNAVKPAFHSNEKRFVRIRVEANKNTLRINISSNGADIEDMLEYLPIIRRLAKKHGWKFKFASAQGLGTETRIEIDISQWKKRPPNRNGAPPTSDASPSGGGSTSGAGKASTRAYAYGTYHRTRSSLGSFDPETETTSGSPGRTTLTLGAALLAARRRRKARGVSNNGMSPQPTPPVGPSSASTQGAMHLFNSARPLPIP
jgi:hypothetical protein